MSTDTSSLRAFIEALPKLNQPMLARLRRCAADNSSNWDGAVTIYPPEARGLVALIDALCLNDEEQRCPRG